MRSKIQMNKQNLQKEATITQDEATKTILEQ